MSILRRNPRVDSNQAVIVKELRDRGALVIILGQPVDLLVGYRGSWCLVEVKAGPKSKIQPSQQKFLEQCREHQVACILMDDLDDVDYWFPDTSRSPADVILSTSGKDADATSGTSNTKDGC